MSNGNLGYLFYRCAYLAADPNSDLLKEQQFVNTSKLERVWKDAPVKATLSERLKPYMIKSDSVANESMPDAWAKLRAQLQARQAQKYGKKNEKKKPTQQPAQQQADPDKEAMQAAGIVSFDLKVLYPGVYAGLGYEHGLPNKEDDIKTGFSFDYTTGLPYIPGSSLKGMLRSHFIDHAQDVAKALDVTLEALRAIEELIFGNRPPKEGGTEEAPDALAGSCTFFDVFPVLQDTAAPLMAEDNLAPHEKALAEPKLIKTIRLAPGCLLRFYFQLPDVEYGRNNSGKKIAAKDIQKLFQSLLVDWGIGAKTHVGYGNLARVNQK